MLRANVSLKEKTMYRDKLQNGAKARYVEKIGLINDLDPYVNEQWCCDPEMLPPVSIPDIFAYLVCGVSAYTCEQFRNYQSLEAHVLFTNGWVQDLKMCNPTNCDKTVILTQVMDSQRLNEPPLQPWVIVSADARIECGHCTCMAGIAETCTHVEALLFKADAMVKIRAAKTMTDESACWMLPGSVDKVGPEVGYNIDFTSAAAQRKALDRQICGGTAQPAIRTRARTSTTPKATLEDLAPLLRTLHAHRAVCLSGVEGYYPMYKDPVQPSTKGEV